MSGPSQLSRETRVLRLGGIWLLVLATGVLLFLQSRAEPERLLSANRTEKAVLAIAFVISVNVFMLGLVLLLTGLRQLSLRHNAHARRGAIVRMAAVNLMLVVVLGPVLQDVLDIGAYADWYALPAVLVFLLIARTSIRMFRAGWKHEASTADEVLARDPRPPVVYLRSFSVDDELMVPSESRLARVFSLFVYWVSVSPEQELAWILNRVGPVVAIGKPGERLPELGAARLYVGNADWHQTISALMNRAALVVIRAGDSANLWWEIEQAMTHCAPERVIVVALGTAKRFTAFDKRFIEEFGAAIVPPEPARSPLAARMWRALFLRGRNLGRIIYFDRQRTPHEQPIVFSPTLWWFITNMYSANGPFVREAFKSVFQSMNLPWTSSRTLTGAVLLALFGGAFGLHLFYLGNRRQGWRRCAFCWTGVPVVLGIRDAVRLARLDDAQFQEHVLRYSSLAP